MILPKNIFSEPFLVAPHRIFDSFRHQIHHLGGFGAEMRWGTNKKRLRKKYFPAKSQKMIFCAHIKYDKDTVC